MTCSLTQVMIDEHHYHRTQGPQRTNPWAYCTSQYNRTNSALFFPSQMLTNAFQGFDTNRNGWITINYEQFLSLVFSLKT